MSKKEYITPEVEIEEIETNTGLMAASESQEDIFTDQDPENENVI